jgi:prevent-host-death family protein
MKTFTSTEVQQNFGDVLNISLAEPVKIQKHKKDCAVIISAKKYAEFERITELLEDNLLAAMVNKVTQEGFMPDKDSDNLLNNIRNA